MSENRIHFSIITSLSPGRPMAFDISKKTAGSRFIESAHPLGGYSIKGVLLLDQRYTLPMLA
uniref:Uncharacterized protein n=1 Tax=Tetranychus urticae TaxID=32264 RepID=T1L5E7_TETUR